MRKEQKRIVGLTFVIALLLSLISIGGVSAEDAFTYVLTDQGAIITDYHYTDSPGKDVVIPKEIAGKKVIGIGDNAFSGTKITSVDFTKNDNNLQFIGSGAFFNCDELTSIEIPTSVTKINNNDSNNPYVGAFENCAQLARVEIPQSVTDMGIDVFKDSPNVKLYGVAKSYAEDYATEYDLPFVPVELPVIEKLEIDKSSGINIGNAIKLKATASGGKAPYTYKFYFERDGEEGLLTDFQTASSFDYSLTKAGNYTFYAVVKDANNKTYTKAFQDYLVINEPVVVLAADKASKQYVNTDITLTATVAAATGTEPYIYNFYYQLGKETEVIEENSGDNETVFRPAEAGTYTLFVEVEDAEGLVRRAEIKEYVIVDELSVGSFTVAPTKEAAKKPEINSTVKLQAQGAGGKTGYQYHFYYEFAEKTFEIQSFSPKNTAEFKPSVAGSYTLYVDVKNGSGTVSTQMIEGYTVVDTPVINSLTTDLPSGQSVDTPITLTADVSGGTKPYQYNFFYQLGSGKKTPILEDDAAKDDNKIIFTPSEKGTYKLSVEVKDADPNSSLVTKDIANYKVIPELEAKSLVANKASGQNINTIIKLTAAGTGGTPPYEYEFSYRLGEEEPVVFREYSKTKTTDFIPQKAGKYTLTVNIKDANGKVVSAEITPYMVLNNPVVTSFKTNLPSGQYVNTEIGLVAESSGGTGAVTYSFTAKNGNKDASAMITQNVAGSAEAIFKPTLPGTYTLTVNITDPASGKATQNITNYKVIAGVSVTKLSAKIGKEPNIGDKIPLTASATGGKSPYEYEFSYQLGADAPVVFKEYSKTKTADFIPSQAGAYKLAVKVKDANGVESPTTELGTGDITVANNPIITNFAASKPSGQYVGEEIALMAEVAGGTAPYTYTFTAKNGSNDANAAITQAVAGSDKAVFTPTAAGNYTLSVDVVDNNGKTASKSILKYNVLAKPSVSSLKASKASPQNLGTAIRLTATAVGGKAPYQYEFSYQLGADAPVVFKAFSTAKTVEFKPVLPGEAGTYQFSVKVKDANGIISEVKQLDSGAFTITDNPVITSYKAGLPSGQYINTAIPLTVEASGGTTVTYHFYYKLGTAAPVDIEAASVDKIATFTPTAAGIYTLYVDAVDSAVGGKTVTKTITNYKVIDVLSGNLAISKTTATVNESIKLTATAAGGKSPYRYKFYYKKDGAPEEVLIRNYSTTRTASFAPDAAGTYEIYLEITDNDKGTAPIVKSETLTVN